VKRREFMSLLGSGSVAIVVPAEIGKKSGAQPQ
jgi:hypothetical protein